MSRKLEIYWQNKRAGILEEINNSLYRFTYDKEYQLSSLPPVSLTLPKAQTIYESNYLFPCFSNLLPEGTNRKTICRKKQIDEKDLFGILMAFAEKNVIGNLEVRIIK